MRRTDYAARALQIMEDRANGLHEILPIDYEAEARGAVERRLAAEALTLGEDDGRHPRYVVDEREQIPWWLAAPAMYPHVERGTLESGDYSLEGYEDRVAVERKTLADLFGSCGGGRERFEREWERMSHLDFAVVVIEASFADVLRGPERSRMAPKAVINTLLAWSVRYGVHVVYAGTRRSAERLGYRMLEWFWREQRRETLRGAK